MGAPTSCVLRGLSPSRRGAQVTLGVSTLLTYVPVSLGAAHQAGALTLFTVVLGLLHSLRRPTAAVPTVSRVRSWTLPATHTTY